MSITKPFIEQTDPPRSPRETLPTMYDLKSESVEESGLPDEYHLWQAELCSATFCPPNYQSDRIFVASDLNLYYDVNHPNWYKRPDWYAVVGVPRLYEERELRLSYVIWQEGVRPIVAIELLSPGTRQEDLGQTERGGSPPTKWEVYEQILAIPYYIVFDRYTDELRVFWLEGDRYRQRELTEPRIWLPTLELGIGLWFGDYRGLERQWLRWYDAQGNWIPTPTEAAQQRAESAEQRVENAQRAQQEAIPRLLNMGLSVEQVAEALGLSVEQVNQWGQE
ncbi:Uma2 family endonuclease [Coleofasciculus sp.]|uniref:Uma2 family endonuclease n=1 Tax=Coleofasciculus sp. TaxID=3100458 RepID=UPI0039F7C05F